MGILEDLRARRQMGGRIMPSVPERPQAQSLLDIAKQGTNSFMNYQPLNQSVSMGDIARMGVNVAPVSGDAVAIDDARREYNQGNYGMAALNAATVAPVAGGLIKGAMTLGKMAAPAIASGAALYRMMSRAGAKHPTSPFSNQAGVIGYHGTPYNIDRFSSERIGTGEGAQAYGHGLYFAENPDVAKDYQKTLSESAFLTKSGEGYNEMDFLKNPNIRATLRKTDGDINATINKANEIIKSIPNTQGAEFAVEDIKVLQDLAERGGISRTEGNLYKVDIDDEAIKSFLDWEKPLAEQSGDIKKYLSTNTGAISRASRAKWEEMDLLASNDSAIYDAWDNGGLDVLAAKVAQGSSTPKEIAKVNDAFAEYRSVYGKNTFLDGLEDSKGITIGEALESLGIGKEGNASISSDLREMGVKGIKYLDGTSRADGAGTSNFVTFDDSLIKILERNGVPQ